MRNRQIASVIRRVFGRLRSSGSSSTHLRVWKAATVASAVVVAKIHFGGLVAARSWIVWFRFGASKRSLGSARQMLRQLARNARLGTVLRFSARSFEVRRGTDANLMNESPEGRRHSWNGVPSGTSPSEYRKVHGRRAESAEPNDAFGCRAAKL
jgi:hypothetical protein